MSIESCLYYHRSKDYIFLAKPNSYGPTSIGPVFWHRNRPVIDSDLKEKIKREYEPKLNHIFTWLKYIYLNEDLSPLPLSNDDLEYLNIFRKRRELIIPGSDEDKAEVIFYEVNSLTHECKISFRDIGSFPGDEYQLFDVSNCVANESIILYLDASGRLFIKNIGQSDCQLLDDIVSIGVTKSRQYFKKEVYAISRDGDFIIIRDEALDDDPYFRDNYLEGILSPYEPNLYEPRYDTDFGSDSDPTQIHHLKSYDLKTYNDKGDQVHLYSLRLNDELVKSSFKDEHIYLTQSGDLYSNCKDKIASNVKDFFLFREYAYYQDEQDRIHRYHTKYKSNVLLEELSGASFIPSFPRMVKSSNSRYTKIQEA